jgi:DnaK suppressor protein
MDLEKFKTTFLQRKQNILDSLRSADEEIDIDGDEVDEAAGGTIGYLSVHLSKRNLKTLKDIERALVRIEEGTFGKCDECGESIGEKRLIAKPDAITCISCAEKLEHTARQFAVGQ